MTDVYTIDEVARHNNEFQNLWIVIHGGVYNITKFFKEHPGGEEVLLQLAGQDATECFDSIGHSREAINLREKFKIGELENVSSGKSETTKTTAKTTETAEVKEPMEEEKPTEPIEPIKPIESQNSMFICTVIAIYAIIIFYWFNKL